MLETSGKLIMIDVQEYYKKLANNEALSEADVVALLKELSNFQHGAAYLASCQAATLQGLPKSTSKSQRQRHQSICLTAAKILQGDLSDIRHKTTLDYAMNRCLNAASCEQPIKG